MDFTALLLVPFFGTPLTLYLLHRFIRGNGGYTIGHANHADHEHTTHSSFSFTK